MTQSREKKSTIRTELVKKLSESNKCCQIRVKNLPRTESEPQRTGSVCKIKSPFTFESSSQKI